ncbi:MAG: hypothetical protein KJ737_08290 [Proteobacteria bacterium]|nr:hypothetical protein [Pseudomonadota bacterium]
MKQVIRIIIAWLYFMMAGEVFAGINDGFTIDMATLKAGKLQIFTEEFKVEGEGKRKRVIGVILINKPPGDVWEVLKDWDSMGQYVPGLKYYKTIHTITPIDDMNNGETLIEGELDVPIVTVTYTVNVTFRASENYRVEWHLLSEKQIQKYCDSNIPVKANSSGLKSIEGFGYLEAVDDGLKTVYTYAPIVEISIPIPGFVERYISKSSLKGYLNAVKKHVESKEK